MKFLTLNGITLHYRHEGERNGVPLVLIHSLGCDLRLWDDVVPHLLPFASIVRFDNRGHGLSDAPPAPYAMRDLAGDVIGLLDHLGIEKAVLAGVSVGGMIAQQVAVDFPERVLALVLCNTAAKIGTEDSWNERIQTLRQHGMPYLAEAIIGRWFTADFIEQNPAVYRGFYNLLTRMALEGYIGTCAALRDTDLRDKMAGITLPTLVLSGVEDKATPPDLVRGLADSIPNARFVALDHAAHNPTVDQPEQVAAALTEFLKEPGYARK